MGDVLNTILPDFWRCFVPLFVAVDAVGLLPIYMALTEGFSRADHRRVLVESTATALAVGVAFLWLGRAVFRLLEVTIVDFMIAGGTLLFILALTDLIAADKRRRRGDPSSMGAVPLGVPLLVGPAVLTTVLLLADQYGSVPATLALLLNLLLAAGVLRFAQHFDKLLGRNGVRTISKVASLILAAIAVKMVRMGIVLLLNEILAPP